MLLCFHYLLRVDALSFFEVVKRRFIARNVTTSTKLISLTAGYLSSYLWAIFLFIFFTFFLLFKNGKVEIIKEHRIIMFVLLFPLLENVIMKQHAVSYTYDRMKGAFFISFIICELSYDLIKNGRRCIKALVIAFVLLISIFNASSYKNDKTYIWNSEYRYDNSILANFINI